MTLFFYLGFLSRTFTIHRTGQKGGGYFLTPFYYFRLLHRHLDISRAVTAVSSPLHITSIWSLLLESSGTLIDNLTRWCRQHLMYPQNVIMDHLKINSVKSRFSIFQQTVLSKIDIMSPMWNSNRRFISRFSVLRGMLQNSG